MWVSLIGNMGIGGLLHIVHIAKANLRFGYFVGVGLACDMAGHIRQRRIERRFRTGIAALYGGLIGGFTIGTGYACGALFALRTNGALNALNTLLTLGASSAGSTSRAGSASLTLWACCAGIALFAFVTFREYKIENRSGGSAAVGDGSSSAGSNCTDRDGSSCAVCALFARCALWACCACRTSFTGWALHTLRPLYALRALGADGALQSTYTYPVIGRLAVNVALAIFLHIVHLIVTGWDRVFSAASVG